MLKIGVTGGLASGKSKVAQTLHSYGAGWINVDVLTHRVVVQPKILDQMEARWQRAFGFTAPKVIPVVHADEFYKDLRKKIAKIVFTPENEVELRWLENLTYPAICKALTEALIFYGSLSTVVIDSPLLFECQFDRYCDEIWFVDANTEIRCQRYINRQINIGAISTDFDIREANQWSVERKKESSTIVIDNSGAWGETLNQIRSHWDRIVNHRIDTSGTS
jgi:dephospho-CoA kinase